MKNHPAMTRPLKRLWWLPWGIAMAIMALSPVTVWANPDKPAWVQLNNTNNSNLTVPLNQSSLLGFQREIAKISIGNPDIADLLIINPKQMYVLGKALGSTNVLVMDDKDQLITAIQLEVAHDLQRLRNNLQRLLPTERIRVDASQGSIILSGEVSSVNAIDTALKIARTHLPQSKGLEKTKGAAQLEGNGIVNLMTVRGPQQIMLEVHVAEISRQFLKSMDTNFNLAGSDGRLKMGAISGGSALNGLSSAAAGSVQPQGLAIPEQGVFANYLDKNLMFNTVLALAKEKGLAKVLSEPTLTTLSGQKARFMSGGEFPVPVPDSDGRVTIQFKEYGVALEFIPIVMNDQRIKLDLDLAVSELSNGNTVALNQGSSSASFFIPSLRKRSVQNTVQLSHGQTLGIAGLINDNVREKINKYPGLAKLPIIGALFRSQEFIKGQTELVIFVTPRFAQAGHRDQFISPTKDFIEPKDSEFFLEGKTEGRGSNQERLFPQFVNKLKNTAQDQTRLADQYNATDDSRGR